MEKRDGGFAIRITNAARLSVFKGSCSLSNKKVNKNTETIMTARWVDGEKPAIIP